MGSLKDWLQLFRSHTSPLEMLITTSGAALAMGTLWDLKVLLFLIFGWLYHNAGYGHNSVEDFIRGYDREDPHKSHHPLQRGTIRPKTARIVTVILILISFIFGALISDLSMDAVILLAIITFLGFMYNIWGKRMKGKFIPIAGAHALLFPFAFLGSGGSIPFSTSDPYITTALGTAAFLAAVYLVIQIIYQIMIEGDLKDLDQDEASLLRWLGVRVQAGEFLPSISARALSFILKAACILILFAILNLLGGSFVHLTAILVFAGFMLIMDHLLMGRRKWDHGNTLRNMAIMEVFSIFALVTSISPEIGWGPTLILMVGSILYFIILNRYLWGTLLIPKV